MRSAVVSSFAAPPACLRTPEPSPAPGQVVLEVLASGLHPVVRAQAAGTHYTATVPPFVPGVDGVGRDAGGNLCYFLLLGRTGALADRVAVPAGHLVPLPPDTDPVALAATMNPATSSWLALRGRAGFQAGQHVLVLGATGGAGRMAVQVARLLGAGRITAVGRCAQRLAALPEPGATDTTTFDELGDLASVDVVLDYVWGQPAADVLHTVVTARGKRPEPLTWVQIGTVAGEHAPLPATALRRTDVRLLGSGLGTLSAEVLFAELPALAGQVRRGGLAVPAHPRPLAAVTEAWTEVVPGAGRVVFVPEVS
ncbi:NADPH:quinone reductase-like Zn-dependent oxidoreductase [Crossiella equi]|uniref:NADPH:quinone reductase-like Zn-dependent oxidoreductase n=1 Tax=Crossiella equi TaxID=130796 RepID=A0ABS5A749_9PSEU|nr:zinc-binding alcohol dehydrogenase family protein [Crossiella equi]MBP2471520.1 NADPH:quinone reductase-like Zn-dependent oxidoreductase [Crossiella equi]